MCHGELRVRLKKSSRANALVLYNALRGAVTDGYQSDGQGVVAVHAVVAWGRVAFSRQSRFE